MSTWTSAEEDKLQDWMKRNKLGLFYDAPSGNWAVAHRENKPLYWFDSVYHLKLFLIKKMTQSMKKQH